MANRDAKELQNCYDTLDQELSDIIARCNLIEKRAAQSSIRAQKKQVKLINHIEQHFGMSYSDVCDKFDGHELLDKVDRWDSIISAIDDRRESAGELALSV
jgi:hypothetical protein